jgi:FAD/FMN-containing dehydrogenase
MPGFRVISGHGNDGARVSANTVIVDRKDPRFDTLKRASNLRFPKNDAEAVGRIVLCNDAAAIEHALQRIVTSGIRPTVRSGGHCYEDFVVNNPNGAIIDLSLHNKVDAASSAGPFRIAPGARLGEIYQILYKRHNVTLPAGTCYMVGAGGHISGGGYGLLARQHGLTVDWITALDIATVDPHGKVTTRRVDHRNDPDLFRACRGAGGGNFGIITNFYFDRLPSSPIQVAQGTLDFPWTSLTQERFDKLLTLYGDYWDTRGREPETWGLSSVMTIGRRQPGSSISIAIQYCNADGNAKDLAIVHEFLERFSVLDSGEFSASSSSNAVTLSPWLEATLAGGDTGGVMRAKYKSTYMKKPFTEAEGHTLYKFLTSREIDAQGFVLSVDGYGGATNASERIQDTAIAQRESIMKLQWQCYWTDTTEDARHLKFMDDFYTAMYTGSHVPLEYQGTPFGDRYQGCYMNYADADMLRYKHWPELYYGTTGLYPFLQQVKRTYDSNNIFHSSMSIRA